MGMTCVASNVHPRHTFAVGHLELWRHSLPDLICRPPIDMTELDRVRRQHAPRLLHYPLQRNLSPALFRRHLVSRRRVLHLTVDACEHRPAADPLPWDYHYAPGTAVDRTALADVGERRRADCVDYAPVRTCQRERGDSEGQ